MADATEVPPLPGAHKTRRSNHNNNIHSSNEIQQDSAFASDSSNRDSSNIGNNSDSGTNTRSNFQSDSDHTNNKGDSSDRRWKGADDEEESEHEPDRTQKAEARLRWLSTAREAHAAVRHLAYRNVGRFAEPGKSIEKSIPDIMARPIVRTGPTKSVARRTGDCNAAAERRVREAGSELESHSDSDVHDSWGSDLVSSDSDCSVGSDVEGNADQSFAVALSPAQSCVSQLVDAIAKEKGIGPDDSFFKKNRALLEVKTSKFLSSLVSVAVTFQRAKFLRDASVRASIAHTEFVERKISGASQPSMVVNHGAVPSAAVVTPISRKRKSVHPSKKTTSSTPTASCTSVAPATPTTSTAFSIGSSRAAGGTNHVRFEALTAIEAPSSSLDAATVMCAAFNDPALVPPKVLAMALSQMEPHQSSESAHGCTRHHERHHIEQAPT